MRNSRFLSFLVALAPAALAIAQGISGSIQGTVMDSSGAAIPDARVVARNLDTGITLETRSNQVGLYFVGELRPGKYQLEADTPGFSEFRQSGIVLHIEDRLRVDIRLELRTVSSSVEVAAEAPLVQSENNTIGKVVEERSIKQLPLSGRNAFALTLLVPGVQQRRDDEQPRLSGGRSRNGEFLLDGTSITDVRRGELRTQPNLDAIQEFKVQTAGLSADVGRAVGGIVNATLKSGTNEFHGNVYEFHRNDNLNARNAFARTVPKLIQNQFGGMIGGPIIKQRTFFFTDYEGFRTAREEVFAVTVPTPRMKRGDFGELLGVRSAPIPWGVLYCATSSTIQPLPAG
jgi:Carboxypeptidase regulatory-like domain